MSFRGKRKDSQTLFARRQKPKPEYSILIHRTSQAIQALVTYKHARLAIEADELWLNHMNKLVGGFMGSSRLEIDGVLRQILTRSLKATDQFELSEAHFDKQVNALEKLFLSSTIEFIRTTPLYGITLQEDFAITDAISIESLSDDEVVRLLNIGLLSGNIYGSGGDFVHEPARVAIVSRFSAPKAVYGDSDPPAIDTAAVTELWNRLYLDEAKAIDLLTLTLDVAIRPIGSVTASSSVMNSSYQIQKNALVIHGDYQPSLLLRR